MKAGKNRTRRDADLADRRGFGGVAREELVVQGGMVNQFPFESIAMELLHAETSEAIIKSFYQVYNTLGYGFLEKVYENSMRIALRKTGHTVVQQSPIVVQYENEAVGDYFADLLVDARIIVEVKAAQSLCGEHEPQLLNCLRATGI